MANPIDYTRSVTLMSAYLAAMDYIHLDPCDDKDWIKFKQQDYLNGYTKEELEMKTQRYMMKYPPIP